LSRTNCSVRTANNIRLLLWSTHDFTRIFKLIHIDAKFFLAPFKGRVVATRREDAKIFKGFKQAIYEKSNPLCWVVMVVSFSPIQEALLSSGRGSFHMVRRAFGDCC